MAGDDDNFILTKNILPLNQEQNNAIKSENEKYKQRFFFVKLFPLFDPKI